MDDATEASREHFDRWAGTYEQDRRSRWLATLQQPALEALGLGPDDRLLDVGCGSGAAVRSAAGIVREAVGLDLSPEMIAKAERLAGGISNVRFLVGDAEHLGFDDGAFTAVLCTTSLHHYPHPERAIGEMTRVLAPGGRLVIGDGCADRLEARVLDSILRRLQPSHIGFYRSTELAGFLYGAGLGSARVRRLLGGGYVLVQAERR